MKISREKRVEEILKALFKGDKFTTKNLSYKYGVDIRVIQKDIKYLKEQYPLQKIGKEYSLPDEYILKDTQEMHPLAMDMAMSIINKTLPKYKDILQDSLNVEISDIFLFDFEIEEVKDEKLFLLLKEAIKKKIAIKFLYKKHDKNVYPMKITNFNSYWYLIGYDLEAQIIKTFYLDNITNIEFYKESFLDDLLKEKLKNIEITSSWFNENPKKTELILLNEAKKYILRRTPKNINILNQTDDFIEIEFNYYNEVEVLNFIKKWLNNIKIKDKFLKKSVKELLEYSISNI